MKRNVLLASFALSVVLFLSPPTAMTQEHQHDTDHSKPDKEVTLTGEVLDLYCYMKHPANGQGTEHAKCAKSCIRKGLPIGFMADGEVYLIIGKEHENASDLVVAFAGIQARLTGTLIQHDGVKAIEIETIEAVPSGD